MTTNLIFLIPGFLGFENFEDYAYFAERVSTALRAIVNERTRGGGVVVPVPLPPTGSLAERQLALGKALTERAKLLASERDVVIHLVGHSTGGVDAQLLTMGRALGERSWSNFEGTDVRWLRVRIRSVISVASPHQGTCFAVDPVARWFASDSPLSFLARAPAAGLRALPGLARVLLELRDIIRDPDLRKLLSNLLASSGTWPFLKSIAGSRALIDDLVPSRSTGRYQRLGEPLPVLRRSFVTLAGTTPARAQSILDSAKHAVQAAESARAESAENPSNPDALFALLLDLTSGRGTGCSVDAPLLAGSIAAVEAALTRPSLHIKAATAPLPSELDATVSDGVVNTVRQLIDPNDPNEIAGVAVADHFDVIGHFDRQQFEVDSKTATVKLLHKRAGLLHSGSQFRDEQFFLLMRRIVDAMAPSLEP